MSKNRNKWNEVRLGPLCQKIGSGITPRGGDKAYIPEGIKLIRSQNVYNLRFYPRGLVCITNAQAEKMSGVEVKKHDVLLNITGDSVARCCIAPDDLLPARVNQHVTIIRPTPDSLNPNFLAYFLTTPNMQNKMLSLAGSGGTRKALTKAMIEDFMIPLPPAATQTRILDVLKPYSDAIFNNERRIELLERSARLLFEEWFVHFRYPGHESQNIVKGIPYGWNKKPLGDVAFLEYGKALKEETRIPGDIAVYGSSGVVGSHNTRLVQGPGIIVGRKGNVGSVFWSPGDFWPIDTTYYVEPKQVSLFVYHLLLTQSFTNSDAAVPGLNREYAHKKQIVWPDQRLIDLFEKTVSPLFRQKEILLASNEKLTQARDLLLPRLMDGRISA